MSEATKSKAYLFVSLTREKAWSVALAGGVRLATEDGASVFRVFDQKYELFGIWTQVFDEDGKFSVKISDFGFTRKLLIGSLLDTDRVGFPIKQASNIKKLVSLFFSNFDVITDIYTTMKCLIYLGVRFEDNWIKVLPEGTLDSSKAQANG